MKILRDTVFLSSLLFTIAFLAYIPHNLTFASTWQRTTLQQSDSLYIPNYYAPIGFASLAFDLVGLIVVWWGYVHRVRWTWFVMFVIVWVYAFPVLVLPLLLKLPINVPAWFQEALRESGRARDYAKATIVFLLMVLALFLPVRSFFRKQQTALSGGG